MELLTAKVENNKKTFFAYEDEKEYAFTASSNENWENVKEKVKKQNFVDYEKLSSTTQDLLDTSLSWGTGISFTVNTLKEYAMENDSTYRDVKFSLERDNEYFLNSTNKPFVKEDSSGIELDNSALNYVSFPVGHFAGLELVDKKFYAKEGVAYEYRQDGELYEDIADMLKNVGGMDTPMDNHIAEVIADLAVGEIDYADNVAEALDITFSNMSHGCESGSIPEMIYDSDVTNFFKEYKDDVLDTVQELYPSSDMSILTKVLPEPGDWTIRGEENQKWAAKTAYEVSVSDFRNAFEQNREKFADIEVFRKKVSEKERSARIEFEKMMSERNELLSR